MCGRKGRFGGIRGWLFYSKRFLQGWQRLFDLLSDCIFLLQTTLIGASVRVGICCWRKIAIRRWRSSRMWMYWAGRCCRSHTGRGDVHVPTLVLCFVSVEFFGLKELNWRQRWPSGVSKTVSNGGHADMVRGELTSTCLWFPSWGRCEVCGQRTA